MMAWTTSQTLFISDHLAIDMTAGELGRFFMVKPADIYQAARNHRPTSKHTALVSPLGFHTPGGGSLWSKSGIPGATIADEYEPEPHEAFQVRCRPEGWVRQ